MCCFSLRAARCAIIRQSEITLSGVPRMMKKCLFALLILAVFHFLTGHVSCSSAADVGRMSKDELRGMLGNPDLVIIDVRTEKEWRKSDKKISGATWEDADEFASWAAQYPKDKTMVLYCS